MYGLTQTAEPAAEPVSVDDAKLHARVDGDAEDDLILSWIKAARRLTEKWTGRRWVTQTLTLSLAHWPCNSAWFMDRWAGYYSVAAGWIRLPVEPVQSVTAVRYYDAAGVLQSVSGIQTWLDHSPPLVTPSPLGYWPALQPGKVAPVRVEFVCGYGNAAAVPDEAKAAILLAVAYWYEHRGDGKDPTEYGLPAGACRLLTSLATGSYL